MHEVPPLSLPPFHGEPNEYTSKRHSPLSYLKKRSSVILTPRKKEREPETLDDLFSSCQCPTDPKLLSSRHIDLVEATVGEEKFHEIFQKQWESGNSVDKEKAAAYFNLSNSSKQAKLFSCALKRETSFLNLVKKDNQTNFYSKMSVLERFFLINDLHTHSKKMRTQERIETIRTIDESLKVIDADKLFQNFLEAIDVSGEFDPVSVFKNLSLTNQLKFLKYFHECHFQQMILIFKQQLKKNLRKRNNKVFTLLSLHFSSLGESCFLMIFEMMTLKQQLNAINVFDNDIFTLVRPSFISHFNSVTEKYTDLEYYKVFNSLQGEAVKERLKGIVDKVTNPAFKDAISLEEELNKIWLSKLEEAKTDRDIAILIKEVNKAESLINSILIFLLQHVKTHSTNNQMVLKILIFCEKYLNANRRKFFSLRKIMYDFIEIPNDHEIIKKHKNSLSYLISQINGFYFSKDLFVMLKNGSRQTRDDIIYAYSRYLNTYMLLKNFFEFFFFKDVSIEEKYKLLGFFIRWVELIDLKEINDSARSMLRKIIYRAKNSIPEKIKRRGCRLEKRLTEAAAREMKEYISSPKRDKDIDEYDLLKFKLSKTRTRQEIQKNDIINDLQIWSQKAFLSVELIEFIGCPWMRGDKYHSICSGIIRLIQGYEHISHHMSQLLLRIKDEKERKRVHDFFMKIAGQLLNEGNIFASSAIFMGLNVPMVTRTFRRNTVAQIEREYADMAEVFEPKGNYKNLRNHIKDLERYPGQLVLPPITLILSDHFHVEDSIADFDGDRINKYKIKEIGKLIRDFKGYQKTIVQNKPKYRTNISQLLFESAPLKENELWDISYERVPTSRSSSYETTQKTQE